MGEKIEKSDVLNLIERLKNSGMGKDKTLNHMYNVVQFKMQEKSFIQKLPKTLKIEEDISYTNDHDRIYTKLILDDYDWMNYILRMEAPLLNGELLIAEFEYFGTTISWLRVMVGDERREFSYSTEIFEKYIKKYMEKHLESWDSSYAFDGENVVIEFWNEVMHNFTSINYDDECSFKKL